MTTILSVVTACVHIIPSGPAFLGCSGSPNQALVYDSGMLSALGYALCRRLVRPFLLALLSRKLRIGGTFHVATDVDVYAEHVSKVVSAGHELVERLPDELPTNTNLYWRGGETSERPAWRPLTDYERKAREAGRRVRDFRYRLAEESSPLIGAAGDARPE